MWFFRRWTNWVKDLTDMVVQGAVVSEIILHFYGHRCTMRSLNDPMIESTKSKSTVTAPEFIKIQTCSQGNLQLLDSSPEWRSLKTCGS